MVIKMYFGKKLIVIMMSVVIFSINAVICVSANEDIAIETSEKTASYLTGGATIYPSGKAGLNGTNWIEFKPDIPSDGQYEVWINAAAPSNAVAELYVNASPVDGQPLAAAAAQASVTVNTGDWGSFSDFQLGTVSLNSGEQSLCFKCKSGGYTLWHIKLKPIIPEFKLTSVTANGTAFNDGDIIPRGTDIFTAEFSTAVDAESLSDAEISVSDGTADIASETEVSGRKLNIILKDTLQYETEYTLKIKNIKGEIADWDLEEKVLSFTTSNISDDDGRGTLSDITHSISSGRAIISGTVSAYKAIKGRKIKVYVVLPSNEEDFVADVFSVDDGKFTVEYSFSDESADGVYKFYLTPEYAAKSECVEIEYNPYVSNHIVTEAKNCSAFYPENMSFWSSGAVSVNTTNWLEYDVEIETEGEYTAKIYAATVGQSMVTFSVDGADVLSAVFPKTGDDYQTYQNAAMGKIKFEAGKHKVRITAGSGALSMKSWELMCITEKQMNMLLSTLKAAGTAQKVQQWFEKNGELLEFDLANDLSQIANKDNFYRHFVSMEADSLDIVKDKYDEFILFEKFNQGDTNTKKAILTNADDCAKLGFDNSLIRIFPSYNDDFFREISGIADYETVEKLSEKYDELCEKYIREEYKADISLTMQNIYSYTGREAKSLLAMQAPIKCVGEIKLKINTQSNLLKNIRFTSGSDPYTKTSVYDDESPGVFTINFDAPQDLNDLLGTLSVVSANEIIGQMNLQGTVTIRVICGSKTVEITNNILPCGANIQITRNSSNSTYSGGGGTGVNTGNKQKPDSETVTVPDKDVFVDIDSVEWAKESIEKLCEKNIITMNEEKTFEPNRNITREEFVKMVVMAVGALDDSAKSDFADIRDTHWSYPYISSAVKYGIVYGKENGCFGLGEEITRQDMAAILARTMKKAGFVFDGYDAAFSDDENIAEYAKDGIYMMRQYGIINGVGGNMFDPLTNATRAVAAKMIYEMIKVVE